MCGIVGAVGPLDPSILDSMIESIESRGPDSKGAWSEDNVHLGHARLSVIDLSESSNQPLWDVNNRAAIIFNGEIYNYKLIRRQLEDAGFSFRSQGDAEVLLNFYLAYGPTELSRLNGVFAFAIWDSEKEQLLVARDAYGVKPFYYAESNGGFYFSSEIKALLKLGSISRELNYDAVLRSVVFLWSPGPETVLKEIKKLEPAHFMIVSKEGRILNRGAYWSWPKYNPDYGSTIDQKIALLDKAFHRSVQEQLVSDVPVGAFLSGGLDSSLIVSASKNAGFDLPCFTIDSASGESNNDGFVEDLPYAREVAKYLDVQLTEVKATPDIITELSRMIYHLDEPQADPAPIQVSLICELAKKQGIKVLLSGAGGDDIFTGYRRHKAGEWEKYWSYLPRFIRSWMQIIARQLPSKSPLMRRLSKAFYYASYSYSQRALSYFYWIDPDVVRGLFRESDQLSDNPMSFMLKEIESSSQNSMVETLLSLDRKYFLVDHNLNYTDKMSMAHGVEVRVPFLDHEVVSLAAKIPNDAKQKYGIGKWVLKRMAEKYLPHKVIYRSKAGFGAPLRKWLNNDLKPLVDDLLGEESLRNRGVFDFSAVRKLVEQDRAGVNDYSYPIFALMCFEIWCRLFLDENLSGVKL